MFNFYESHVSVVRDDTASLRKHLMNAIQLKEDNSESVYSYLSANKEYLPLNTMIMTQKKTEGDPFNTVFTETELESLENVFKDKDTRFKKIFIQGEAGSGKSSFLQKIARDWTRAHEKLENQATSTLNSYEQILIRYFLVLGIPLDKVGDEKRIEDVLSKYVLGKDCPVSPKDCLKLVSKQQANVLFLLDGYDEYSEASNAVAELLQGTLLTDVTIVLTSQSWKLQEPKVSESYDRLIEIKGFKDETAKDFISKFMLSKKIKETDMENIVNQIWTSMDQLENKTSKNPLLLLFACVIWLEKSSVPCKRSEIYKDMISCLHDMFTKEVSDVSSKSKKEKIEDDSKPKPTFQGLLVNVGKIAFRCLLSRKQCPKRVPSHWFNEALYQDYLNLALELGLIHETKVIYKQKEVSIAAVVNKSVEEYLAGYYLCNVNDTSIVFHEQAAIIELINAGKIEKSFVYKFLDILTFVSGINPLIACELLSILIPDMESDSIVMEKLYKCAQEMALLDGLKLPLRCLLFDKNISETLLSLCHETLEYLSFANCQLRGTQNKSYNQVDCGNSQINKSDNQADGLKSQLNKSAVGNSQPCCKYNKHDNLTLFTCTENLQNLKYLKLDHVDICDATLAVLTLPKLEEITLRAISPAGKVLVEVLTKVKSPILEEVTIDYCDFTDEIVSFPKIESLTTLNLGSLKICSNCWKSLLQSLESLPNLKSLACAKSKVIGEGVAFPILKTLTKLELHAIEFDSDNCRADFCSSVANLASLEIIEVTAMNVKKLTANLEALLRLKRMSLNEIVFQSTVNFSKSSLSVLNLNRLTFEDHCGQNFVSSIGNLPNLAILTISYCNFETENINFLKLKSLKKISLVKNAMTSNCWCVSIFSLGQLENLGILEVAYVEDEETNVGALVEDMVDQRSPVPKIVSFTKTGREKSITVDFTNKESLMKTGSCCTQ